MKRDLHSSPNLVPVDEYEPREFSSSLSTVGQRNAHIEYVIDDGENSMIGFCTSDEALLQVLRRNTGKWVRVKRGG